VNGGQVQYEDDANGDKVKFNQQIIYWWNAPAKRLTVAIRYPASGAVNFTRTWGRYNMKGRTNTKITTSTSNQDVSLNYSYPFSFGLGGSVEKTENVRTSFVRVNLANQPYWADQGIFDFRREAFGESYFRFGMDWLTKAYVNLATTVVQHTAECGSSYRHSANVNANVQNNNINGGTGMSAAIKYAGMSKTECKTMSDTLAGQLYFQASNAFACGEGAACPGEAVGERFRSYIRVRTMGWPNCQRLYNVGFTAAVNWRMNLVASNGQTGAGFDLGSGTTVWNVLSNPAHTDQFQCQW
jgi:hypothetical protein